MTASDSTIFLFAVFTNFFAIVLTGSPPNQEVKPWEMDYRIPRDILPVSYDLFLSPNLDEGSFEGKVTVLVNLTSPRDWIPIHIKTMNVSSTRVFDCNNQDEVVEIDVLEAFSYPKNEFWVVKTVQPRSGFLKLDLKFTGSLTRSIVGFYRSVYHENGRSRYIATTKFEPVDARQAFPCFDEPALKAKFKISVVRPKDNYSVLSNMYVLKEEAGPGPNQVTVHFKETVPMSTYLVCFIVSDFQHSGEKMVENKNDVFPIKIYSTPGQVENTLFSRDAAVAVSKFYINYFDVAYALPKMDLIAIPDFVSGAMENWGLITFRETGLLFNETENSAANKLRVATVVSHEISHQWFGNLVTMKWWDDLWLNEGFASFMQFKGVNEGIPECKDWQILDQAIHSQIYDVMKRDSLVSSHPIIQPVNNPNQITEIFDKISYNKGHAVLKMLEGFMGEENFKKGVQKYLKRFMFSNADTSDLWKVLNDEFNHTEVTVADIMDTWTRQMGLPVINVKEDSNFWMLTQERFLIDENASYELDESPYNYKWNIPVHYTFDDKSKSDMVWFLKDQDSIKIPKKEETNFIKLNHKQLGFYRVNYESNTWRAFENLLKLNHEKLHRIDRANLIDDAFNLAGAGKIEYDVALEMSGYLRNEKDFLPWAAASDAFHEVVSRLYSSPLYPNIRQYVQLLIKGLYGFGDGQFSWNVNPNDSHIYRQLRVTILSLACFSGLPACMEDAGAKFTEWIEKPETYIHPDVRSLVYRYGMSASGREKEWDIVWERHLKETNAQEKINLLRALAAVREPWLLSRYVEYAKNEKHIRSQDYFQVLGFISSNPVGNPVIWKFYRNEWPYLAKRFGLSHRTLGTFIAVVTADFSTEVELEEVEAFYKKYPEAGAGAIARKTAVESIKGKIDWLKKNEGKIGKWLSKQNLN